MSGLISSTKLPISYLKSLTVWFFGLKLRLHLTGNSLLSAKITWNWIYLSLFIGIWIGNDKNGSKVIEILEQSGQVILDL